MDKLNQLNEMFKSLNIQNQALHSKAAELLVFQKGPSETPKGDRIPERPETYYHQKLALTQQVSSAAFSKDKEYLQLQKQSSMIAHLQVPQFTRDEVQNILVNSKQSQQNSNGLVDVTMSVHGRNNEFSN